VDEDDFDMDAVMSGKSFGRSALAVAGGATEADHDEPMALGGAGGGHVPAAPPPSALKRGPSYVESMFDNVPLIMRGLLKLLKGKGSATVKTRTAALTLLRTLVTVLAAPSLGTTGAPQLRRWRGEGESRGHGHSGLAAVAAHAQA